MQRSKWNRIRTWSQTGSWRTWSHSWEKSTAKVSEFRENGQKKVPTTDDPIKELCLLPASGLTDISVTDKKTKEVMSLEDETFSRFYRHMDELPVTAATLDDDFDVIFGPLTPK